MALDPRKALTVRIPLIGRPRPTYATITSTIALMLALSMGGAYAHGKIGADDIKRNAVKSKHIAPRNVKTGDLKGKAVTMGKLAPGARPAKVIRYTAGPHDFVAVPSFFLALPGVSEGQIRSGEWAIQVVYGNSDVALLDYDYGAGQGAYMRFSGGTGGVQFQGLSAVGSVDAINVFQTIPLTSKAASPRSAKPRVAPGR